MINLAQPLPATTAPPLWVELEKGTYVAARFICAVEQDGTRPDVCLVYGQDGSFWPCPSSAAALVAELTGSAR